MSKYKININKIESENDFGKFLRQFSVKEVTFSINK